MIADREERRAEAQRLRDAGWSFDRIAAALRYASGAGARRLLHPERFAENDRRNNARRAPIKRAWENANDRPACACGAAMGVGAHRRARRVCAACRNDIYAVGRAMRRERIYELWHRYATLRDIAEALDSTAASMSREITSMRQDGWDMPYRRTPKGVSTRGSLLAIEHPDELRRPRRAQAAKRQRMREVFTEAPDAS